MHYVPLPIRVTMPTGPDSTWIAKIDADFGLYVHVVHIRRDCLDISLEIVEKKAHASTHEGGPLVRVTHPVSTVAVLK